SDVYKRQVQANIREISPKIIFCSTRQYLSMCSDIQVKVSDAGWLKRATYRLFMWVGYRIADMKLAGKKLNFWWRFLGWIGEFALYRPVRDKLGFTKTKYPLCGSTYISPDVMRFYYALGMPLYQVYGSTESGINITHREGEVDIETIGRPAPEVTVRISPEGEIQVKSPGLFAGYYKNPKATAEKMTEDGYYRTGDAGFETKDGRIVYVDRLSDLRQLRNGYRYSPGYIEGKLKFSPYIQEAIALGDSEKDYIAVIVIINFTAAGKWAEDHGVAYTNFPDLSQKDELGAFIKKDIDRVNRVLPETAKIKKYVLLHKEFDPDDAEITRSRKLRRKYIEETYSGLIKAIYDGKKEFEVEALVKYRDGRTGVIKTNLKIRDVD
ncbi:MAG: AMP-binding protein, partial [Dehalococcoidia bacterium]|nr:AMP-binding protein [Dehalococcoidia bacterium]